MRIIISPAKKMNVDTDTLPCLHKPQFVKEANILQMYLQSLTYEEAKVLWKCNDHLAEENYKCLKAMELYGV